MGWQIRCALVLSSIASVGRNIAPALLKLAVEEGLLPASQALYLLRFQSEEKCVKV